MMTDQERQQRFLEAIRAAELTYGLTLQAQVKVEQLGEAVLMRPSLALVAVAGWQEQKEVGDIRAQVNEVKDLAELALELHNKKQNGNGSHIAPPLINQQAKNDLP